MNIFFLVLFLALAILALVPVLLTRTSNSPVAKSPNPDTDAPDTTPSPDETQPEPASETPAGDDQQTDQDNGAETSSSTEETSNDEPVTLSFEPIHTFDPASSPEGQENPWPSMDPRAQHEYDDRDDPDDSSRALNRAVNWLVNAHTEAIHQQVEYREFTRDLLPFLDHPRAQGAELLAEHPWRDHPAHMSRQVGDRYLLLTLGLSAHGPVRMDAHRDALDEFLDQEWNDDGLEQPLLYQCLGRLSLLTPTRPEELQDRLRGRVAGRFPRGQDTDALERVHFHALVLAVCASSTYPFPRAENGLSRLWHWDGHNPPLVTWPTLLPTLFALWVHYWVRDDSTVAANDFGSLLGSWWNEHPPPSGWFDERPGDWEALLMTAWALVPDQPMIWDKIRDCFEEIQPDHPDLESVTKSYFEWVEQRSSEGEPPPEAFSGDRFPPVRWIQPLPTDVLSEGSQPRFEYPEVWAEQGSRLKPPDVEAFRDHL